MVWVPPEADAERRIQVLIVYLGELGNFSMEGKGDKRKADRKRCVSESAELDPAGKLSKMK